MINSPTISLSLMPIPFIRRPLPSRERNCKDSSTDNTNGDGDDNREAGNKCCDGGGDDDGAGSCPNIAPDSRLDSA
jgi:hypothetical protein